MRGGGRPRRRRRADQHGRLSSPASASRSTTRPAGPRSGAVLRRPRVRAHVPRDRARVQAQREDLLHRGGLHPRPRAAPRGDPQPAGAGLLPAPRARDRLRGLLPRRADDPRDHAARLRRAGARSSRACRPRRRSGGSSRSCSSTPRTSRRSTAPGSSRCTRARRRGALARAHATARRCGTSCCRRRCAG